MDRLLAESLCKKYHITVCQLLEILSGENQESIEDGAKPPSSK